jgi:hypothetical protein
VTMPVRAGSQEKGSSVNCSIEANCHIWRAWL